MNGRCTPMHSPVGESTHGGSGVPGHNRRFPSSPGLLMKVLPTLLLLAAPYAVAGAQAPFACDLLTSAEVEAAVGWKPGASESKAYGTTGACTFTGDALKRQVVVLTVARPAPRVASSAAFAERRIADGKRTPELATRAAPIEGLGAPAIRSDDGAGPATIEAVKGGRVMSVSAPTIEAATALAKTALLRVR